MPTRHLFLPLTLALFATACSDDGDEDGGAAANAEQTVNAGQAAATDLTFFVTSSGSGEDGGDLGGLAGADARCDELATAVGAGSKTWRAYLSTASEDARDRIGSGPWMNAAGEMIAADVEVLHTEGLSNGDPQHMLDENGATVPGNEHDILTGSDAAGRLLTEAGVVATCNDWTASGATDPGPRVGHSDIPANPMFSPSWNSAHTAPGCDAASLTMVGGAGRLYCFAQ
jgi:hypothetical protein